MLHYAGHLCDSTPDWLPLYVTHHFSRVFHTVSVLAGSNQGAPPQAMHQQHTGGMPGLPPPQGQGLAQGVRFPSMDRQLLQVRLLLDAIGN